MHLSFNEAERKTLLALKGVGPTVLKRLESMGLGSFEQLRTASVEEILHKGAALTGSSCWKNSPQARAAISAVLECAKAKDTFKDFSQE